MKKIVSLLIMILLIACTVFADDPKIIVQSRVKAEISLDTANTSSAGGLYRLCQIGRASCRERVSVAV